MIVPDIIIRTNRRSLSLEITKTGELVVRAPRRLSVDNIFKYIKEKEKWIANKQKEIQDKILVNKDINNYNQILFLGKKYNINVVKFIKQIELSDEGLLVPEKIKDKIKHIKNWCVAHAKKILSERLEYFANVMQLDYASLTITNNKTRWGSCDSSRNIKLNFRLIMLPHKAIDFVIVHELAHILEMNHSKGFYKVVSSVLPNYKLQQKILKEHDYLLSLYR